MRRPRLLAASLLTALVGLAAACGQGATLTTTTSPAPSPSGTTKGPPQASTSPAPSTSTSSTPQPSEGPLVLAVPRDASPSNTAGSTPPAATGPAPGDGVTSAPAHPLSPTLRVVNAFIPYPETRKQEMADYALQRYGTRTSQLTPSVIVLHFTESGDDPWSTINYFAQDQPNGGMYPQVCSHFVLDKAGTAYQLVPTDVMCRHVVGLNHVALGIEVVQATQGNSSAWADQQILDRPAQLAGLIGLVKSLQAQWGIPTGRIIGHGTANDDPQFLDLTGLRNDHTDWGWTAVQRFRALVDATP